MDTQTKLLEELVESLDNIAEVLDRIATPLEYIEHSIYTERMGGKDIED